MEKLYEAQIISIQIFKNCPPHCYNETDRTKPKKLTIPLVIWAATKNFDFKFLQHLKESYPEYKEYMHRNSDKFLRYGYIGISYETFFTGLEFSNNLVLSKSHLDNVENLIKSRIFNMAVRNHDCQATFNNHGCEYLELIKMTNPHLDQGALDKLHKLAIEIFWQEMHDLSIIEKLTNKLKEIIAYLSYWRGSQ